MKFALDLKYIILIRLVFKLPKNLHVHFTVNLRQEISISTKLRNMRQNILYFLNLFGS